MYHVRFKGNHYYAGFKWGKALREHGKYINKNITPKLSKEKDDFTKECLPIYEKYCPEILEEIKGVATGQKISYANLCTFLMSMYCFDSDVRCTCIATKDKNNILFGRNSDYLASIKKLYMNCIYKLEDAYSFNGNTTAFIEIEDGINEFGLAAGLTYVYPTIIKPGINAGILVRIILEKCKTTKEAISLLNNIPIASQQTLTIADKTGDIVIVECNCEKIKIIKPNENCGFVTTANLFNSSEMMKYNNYEIDNWGSEKRYNTSYSVLKNHNENYSFDLIKDILSGKYGFMCQYDRKKDADTVWSIIYDIKNGMIFRAEGNPKRTKYKKSIM